MYITGSNAATVMLPWDNGSASRETRTPPGVDVRNQMEILGVVSVEGMVPAGGGEVAGTVEAELCVEVAVVVPGGASGAERGAAAANVRESKPGAGSDASAGDSDWHPP